MNHASNSVISAPDRSRGQAPAGIQVVHLIVFKAISPTNWIPAFAGMTAWRETSVGHATLCQTYHADLRSMEPKLINPDHNTYRVTWSEEDSEYVGLCTEWPSLSYLAPTRDEALEGIFALVGDVVADFAANGELIPGCVAAEEGWRLNRSDSSKLVI